MNLQYRLTRLERGFSLTLSLCWSLLIVSNPTKNNQTSSEYLLGALPEAETERLDELSFTDDEFAESLQVAETDLVDAYVLGELTGADLERFKTHYLVSPLRREKVEFAKVLSKFWRAGVGWSLRLSPGEPLPARRGRFAALGVFIAPPPILQWGLAAAALAMLIVGGWVAVENIRLRQQMSQTAARRDHVATTRAGPAKRTRKSTRSQFANRTGTSASAR